MNDEQRKALEEFLLIKCKKGKCDGSWCSVQRKLKEAFGYSDDWNAEREIQQHHDKLKELSSQVSSITHDGNITLDKLYQLDRLTSAYGATANCLFRKHLRLPRIKIASDDKDKAGKIAEAIKNKRSFSITNYSGVCISSGMVGAEPFDEHYHNICAACYGVI